MVEGINGIPFLFVAFNGACTLSPTATTYWPELVKISLVFYVLTPEGKRKIISFSWDLESLHCNPFDYKMNSKFSALEHKAHNDFIWSQTASSSIITIILLQKPVTLNFFSLSKYFVDIGSFKPAALYKWEVYFPLSSREVLSIPVLAFDFSESTQCCKHVTFLSISPYLTWELEALNSYQSQFLIYIRYSNTCWINLMTIYF